VYKHKITNNIISEKLADEVLALPIAEHITKDDVKYISDIIYKFYN